MPEEYVVFISPHVDGYGAELSMISYINFLKENGYNVLVLLPKDGKVVSLLNECNIQYRIIKYKTWINIGKKDRLFNGIAKFIINEIQLFKTTKFFSNSNIKVKLVHSNSIVSSFGAQLSSKFNVPHIQHIREFGKDDFDMYFDLGMRKSMKYCDVNTDYFITISTEVHKKYSKYFKDEKCKMIHNGLPEPQNTAKNMIHDCNDVLQLVMLGRLSSEKRQIDVIKAMLNMIMKGQDRIHLDIYGNGEDESFLLEYINKNKLKNFITLHGYQTVIDYSKYDIGVMASVNEAFGRVTVEYMFNCLAVLGTNSGGTKEIILDNVTGFLYTPKDVDGLTHALQTLYNDKDLCRTMGNAGKERANEFFSEDVYCNNVFTLYKKLGI